MLRAERDADFYRALESACRERAYLTDPAQELASWKEILKELMGETAGAPSA
jgi:hypothetical protein